MEEWIHFHIYLLIFNISPVLTSVKGGAMEKSGDTHIDMNIRVDDIFITNSTTELSEKDVQTFASTTSGTSNTTTELSSHSSDEEDNGMVVIYTVVPIGIFILAGIVLVSILLIRRRRRQHQDENMNIKCDNQVSKTENNNDIGVANQGFSEQPETKKHPNDNVPVPSLYTEIEEEKSDIYYEYETDRNRPESLYYDYNKSDPRLEGIVEDEFGYGQFNHKVEPLTDDKTYQNATELKNIPSDQAYSRKETDSPPLYTNCAEVSSVPKENATKESNFDEDDDPLYDHAKAGGHEWDAKEKDNSLYVNDEIIDQNCSTLQHVYVNNSNGKYLASDDEGDEDFDTKEDVDKIHVYLELEADEGEDKSEGCKQFHEPDQKLHNNVYDYASVGGTHKAVTGDEIESLSTVESKEDDNSHRQYFILEKENTIQVDDNEYEFASNHEYFILEKIER